MFLGVTSSNNLQGIPLFRRSAYYDVTITTVVPTYVSYHYVDGVGLILVESFK